MIKVASSEQMRSIDRAAIEEYGIPGIVLMENAAVKVYSHILKIDGIKNKKVCFVCGMGNNGGDGFAAARHLSLINKSIKTFMIGDESRLKGDALINFNIYKKMGLHIGYIRGIGNMENLIDAVRECDVLVDGLMGTGNKGEITGLYKEVIDIINSQNKYVLSIDVPSGVDADSGRIFGSAIKANKTVTFALPKVGLFTYPGADYAGDVIIEDISIPDGAVEKQNISINLIDTKDIVPLFPLRNKDSNKGTYGRVFIIGGSAGMMGAAAMCGMAALRCGPGIVELGVPSSIQHAIAPLLVEAMVKGFGEEQGALSYTSADLLLESINKASSFVIGPGMSQRGGLFELLKKIIAEASVPGVIDADGLNLLSMDTNILLKASVPLVVTPHPGEMARLLKRDVGFIQQNRIECSKELSIRYNIVTVLKGANTVIASPDGSVYINTTGGPGMAKGGAGDILAGVIGALMAQGIRQIESANAAVHIHGLAGDMAACDIGEYGVKAGDIIEYIPRILKMVSQRNY